MGVRTVVSVCVCVCVCLCVGTCVSVCVVCKQNCKHCINAIMPTRLLQTANMYNYYYTACNTSMWEGAASETRHQQQTSLFPSVKSEDSHGQRMEGGREGGMGWGEHLQGCICSCFHHNRMT